MAETNDGKRPASAIYAGLDDATSADAEAPRAAAGSSAEATCGAASAARTPTRR